MMFELWLMIGSLALMALMLLHRHLEIVRGIPNQTVSEVREKADPVLRKVQYRTNSALSRLTWREAALHIHNLFVYIGRFFMHISYRTHRVSAKIVEKASQRKEDLSKRGAASFYLKQIQDAKESDERGEITER